MNAKLQTNINGEQEKAVEAGGEVGSRRKVQFPAISISSTKITR